MKIERDEVARWARTKPANRRYCYVDISNCPIAQFLREAKGIHWPTVSPHRWFGFRWFLIPTWGRVPKDINDAAIRERTFGAFAERLAL